MQKELEKVKAQAEGRERGCVEHRNSKKKEEDKTIEDLNQRRSIKIQMGDVWRVV